MYVIINLYTSRWRRRGIREKRKIVREKEVSGRESNE